MRLEFLFKILAVVLLGGAAIFLWQKNWDAFMIVGVLAFCSFFLSLRFQIKERLDKKRQADQAAKAAEEAKETAEEESDAPAE
jgi:hypothetical protein